MDRRRFLKSLAAVGGASAGALVLGRQKKPTRIESGGGVEIVTNLNDVVPEDGKWHTVGVTVRANRPNPTISYIDSVIVTHDTYKEAKGSRAW